MPYALENVETAPLENAITLCGSMFGLRVRRHRLFETNPAIYFVPATCNHSMKVAADGRQPDRDNELIGVYGHFTDMEFACSAMGINWMNRSELAQAIPPTYTEFIGKELLKVIL